MYFFLLLACSSSTEDALPTVDNGFATTPVSGKIYNADFNYIGGYATSSVSNGVDKFFIKLTQDNINCADAPADAPLSFSCPKVIALHTSNVNMVFKNSTGGSFVNLLNGV